MAREAYVQNSPKGTTGSLGCTRLFPDIPNSPYVPVGLAIACKDVPVQQLSALKGEFGMYGPPQNKTTEVPGLLERLEFSGPTNPEYRFPFRLAMATTDVLLDVWEDASNAGDCSYIAASSKLHEEIESWGKAAERHATIYVTASLEYYMIDRSPEWRLEMMGLIHSLQHELCKLPSRARDKEIRRRVAEKDQPKVVRTLVLSPDEINHFLSRFLPDWEFNWECDYPRLLHRNSL